MKTFVIIARTDEGKSGMTDLEMAEHIIRNRAIQTLTEAAQTLKLGGTDIEVALLNDDDAEAVVSGWHLQKMKDDDCKREDDHKKQSCRYNLDQEPVTHIVWQRKS